MLHQKYPIWELIIIDDGSTDRTKELVDSFADERIKYFYQRNQGRSIARNNGLDQSKGDIICFLDSDDYLLSDYLKDFVLHAGQIIQCCGYYLEKKNNQKLKNVPTDYFVKDFISNPYNLMPFAFSREIISQLRFDEESIYAEDFQLILPLILRYKVFIIDKVNAVVVDHKNRSINTMYKNPATDIFNQFSNNLLQTINLNRNQILDHITEDELNEILNKKIKSFIRTVAKSDLSKALHAKITLKESYDFNINNVELLLYRLKGLIRI